MATIGTLKTNDQGQIFGAIRTLKFAQLFWLTGVQNTGNSDKPPTYQVEAKAIDGEPCKIGAVWKRRSERGTDYLWFVLDDPHVPEALRCFSAYSKSTNGEFDLVLSQDREEQTAD